METSDAQSGWYVIGEHDVFPILADYARHISLCNGLEVLADALPFLDNIAVAECCNALSMFLGDYAGRECHLQRLLSCETPCELLRTRVVERVRRRHLAGSIAADDLLAALQGEQALPIDALGYLMRGFFDNVRTDIAFEILALLTFNSRHLTPAAAAILVAGIE